MEFATGWLNDTFTQVQSSGPIGVTPGSNCAHFEHKDLERIALGWANVSWTSPSPAAEVMMLTVYGAGPRLEATGPSPLSIEIRDMPSGRGIPILVFLRTPMEAGADVEVEMHLNWTFYYEGIGSLVHEVSGCG